MRLSRRKKRMTKRHYWWPRVLMGTDWRGMYRLSAWYCGPAEGDESIGLRPHPFAGKRHP